MAAAVALSGLTASSLASLRFGNDASARKCFSCGLSSSAVASSSMASASILEVGAAVRNCCPATFSVSSDVVPAFPTFRSQSGPAVSWRGEGCSSRRTCHGRDVAAIGTSGMCRTELRVSRFKVSATKDKSVQSQSVEDTARQSSEGAEEQAVHGRSGEQGVHVGEDSHASTSEGTELATNEEKDDGEFGGNAKIGAIVTTMGSVLLFGGLGAAGYFYKDQINDLVNQFTLFIEGYGSAGYVVFILGYALLELVAIPAIPLTMSAGLLFGVGLGTLVVSLAGLLAATTAFLIARYLARNRLLAYIKGNKKFMAIDKAIGADGFRVVALLRLSPLLPFSLGNYLYGLTSVELLPYVTGSWVGMLPGTWAYVSAGAIGRSFLVEQESENIFSSRPEHLWTLGLGIAVTGFAATYITRVAKDAVKDIDQE